MAEHMIMVIDFIFWKLGKVMNISCEVVQISCGGNSCAMGKETLLSADLFSVSALLFSRTCQHLQIHSLLCVKAISRSLL